MAFKVTFKIANAETEAQCIFKFKDYIENENAAVRSGSHYNIELPQEIKRLLIDNDNFDSVKLQLIKFIEQIRPKIDEEVVEKVRKEWMEIEQTYIDEINKITDKTISLGNIDCYLIFSVCGHYDKSAKRVYVDYNKTLKSIVAICAEEILHLHYWQIFQEVFNIEKHNHKQWKISELIPTYILTDNIAFNKFGWNKWDRRYSYPWIDEMKKKTDLLWKNRKSFKEFLIEVHKAFNCLPEQNI